MKCLNCGQENRATLKFCKKCGRDLTLPPLWFPDWKWHLRTLSMIYIGGTVFFFLLSWALHKLPPPYDQRQIPP
ncbi:MAG TPA: zinc ribbon domain-containing protein, partial [Elusimicrobiales bacterium]|nr:zinc ribbon domain-containing protein [Elusimicrobiales bacterium]